VLDAEPLFARRFDLCIDCAKCVWACNDLHGVNALGFVCEDDRLVVDSLAPALMDSGCKVCGAFVEVCPTGCLSDRATKKVDRDIGLDRARGELRTATARSG
jgi:NADH dehydrogenase/NADH:ubiquinone oxidoreductase subunit G